MNKKISSVVISFILILAVAIGLRQYSNHQNSTKLQQAQNASQKIIATAPKNFVTYKGEEGKTALDILKQKHSVQTKTYSYGELVESIDGVKGVGPKYWTFYVNGKMADVGADSYQTKQSDTIEWKLEQQ